MTPQGSSSKTLADLEWARLTRAIADRCASEPGAVRAMELPLLPDLAAVWARLALVEEAMRLHGAAAGDPVPDLGRVQGIDQLVDRAEIHGVLDVGELAGISATLNAAATAARQIGSRRALYPLLAETAAPGRAVEELAERIGSKIGEDGDLADDASAELRRARSAAAADRARVISRIEELMARHRDVLQDTFYTVREGRYVLPVRTDAHERVAGIVHGTSASGATVFVEPRAVVALGNRLKMAVAEVEREEARILAALSEEVGRVADRVRAAARAAATLDLLVGIARLASDLDARLPRLLDSPRLSLVAARHPLLLLDGTTVVANDIVVEPGRALVVSGPNAGGKTVILKTAGIIALMVRAGLPVPAAEHSEVGFIANVYTDVGDEQSLTLSLSTFSGHLCNLSRILATAGWGDLVLLDELAAGTDPDEGAALARAVVEALCERGATVAVTTHYPALKEAATVDDRFVNASVGFDVGRMEPSFRLTSGIPGASVALAIAGRFGIADPIVARARSMLGEGALDFAEAIARLEHERTKVEEEAAMAKRERERAEQARALAEDELERARARDEKKVSREVAEVLEVVQRTRAQVAVAEARVRRRRVVPEDVRSAREVLAEVAPEIAPGGKLAQVLSPAPQGRPATEADLRPGCEVWIARLGGKARVVEVPRKGKVRVALGKMATTLPVSEVLLLEGKRPAAPTKTYEAPAYDAAADAAQPAQTSDNTCDLRGLRADEALEAGERFFDRMMREGKQCAFLIHGHGTGALRAQVREVLSKSRYVARFRPGQQGEGGDGVTVFWLR
ncbi:MAG: Smr/MutS family protein [Deltaproteobacteria bacterium]|nr:Smr/MutS family protein [Deltaproteobacteria bacterium]